MRRILTFLYCSLLPLTIATSSSYAGSNYTFSVGLSSNDISNKANFSSSQIPGAAGFFFSDNSTSSSDDYGYFISVDRVTDINSYLFVSPSISYENINSTATDNFNFSYKFNDRIITSIKLGIKATKSLTLYPFIGISDVGYEVIGNNVNNRFFTALAPAASNNYRNYANRESSEISGIGASIALGKKFSLFAEYSRQDLDISSRHKLRLNGKFDSSIDSTIESIKLGLTSKF